MAKLFVYSVYDKMVEAYMKPFEARSDGEAIRMFSVSFINRDPARFHVPSADLDLYLVAEWDDAIGEYGVPADMKTKLPLRVITGTQAEALARKSTSPLAEAVLPFDDPPSPGEG